MAGGTNSKWGKVRMPSVLYKRAQHLHFHSPWSSAMANATDAQAGMLKIGGGIIEIATLTALIGSSTAGALILGSKGAVGMVWATMSMFGTLSIVKACAAAATPAWLRESLGVRSPETDAALGYGLELGRKEFKARNQLLGTVGVASEVYKWKANSKEEAHPEETQVASYDVYAFDQQTANILNLLPGVKSTKDTVGVYVLAHDPFSTATLVRLIWKDWWSLAGSLVKLAEVAMLWKQGATRLCWVTSINWSYFFLATVILQMRGISRERDRSTNTSEIDVIAGDIPTPLKAGGQESKIVLGVPKSARLHVWWKLIWGVGGVVCALSVIATYLTLGGYRMQVVSTWIGFQIFWLVLRSMFFHFAEGADRVFHRPVVARKTWQQMSRNLRNRVRYLLFSLSNFQMHVHPRRLYCYKEDRRSIERIENIQPDFPLSAIASAKDNVPSKTDAPETIDLAITAIIGDTMLSSAAWMQGSSLSGLNLYDSCLVELSVDGSRVTIPAARVLTEAPPDGRPPSSDVEAGFEAQFVPRGGSNTGSSVLWWYWIPCGPNRWLQTHTENMQLLGKWRATVVSDRDITAKLALGDLLVSISSVEDVKDIVRHSRLGCDVLLRFLD